jgi:hypothetical protein
MDMDPFTGQPMRVNRRGKAWLRKRMGMSREIDISDDGRVLSYGDSSLCADPKTGIRSFIAGDDAEFLAMNIAAAQAANGAGLDNVPEVMVYLGTDPDYVWPPGTLPGSITPLPYRCPSCSARVKRAPLPWGVIDEIYVCFCACATFQRSATRPRSSGDWQALRLQGHIAGVKHQAKIAAGNS